MPDRSPALMAVATAVLLALAPTGCAHKEVRPSIETLKSSAETFHRMLRWGEVRGTAQFVVPTRRTEYLRRLIDDQADQTLKVTEYELEDARVENDRATVVSSIGWYRMPAPTNPPAAMVIQWIHRDSVWFVESIEGGPVPLPPLASDR